MRKQWSERYPPGSWGSFPVVFSSFLAVSCVTSGGVSQAEFTRVGLKVKELEARVMRLVFVISDMEHEAALKESTPSECDCEVFCTAFSQEVSPLD